MMTAYTFCAHFMYILSFAFATKQSKSFKFPDAALDMKRPDRQQSNNCRLYTRI